MCEDQKVCSEVRYVDQKDHKIMSDASDKEDENTWVFRLRTGRKHRICMPDLPRVTIPIVWDSSRALLADSDENPIDAFHETPALDVLVDGKPVSYGLEKVSANRLEISFKIENGEHDVVVRRDEDGEGPILFARRLRIGPQRPYLLR